MLRNTFLFVCVLAASLTARAADIVTVGGGALAQIVTGGPWKTTITIINMDGFEAPYRLIFYGDDGNLLSLKTTLGQGSSFTGSLPPRGSAIIETSDGNPVTQGWATILPQTNNRMTASAVFRLTNPDNSHAEVALPLDTGLHQRFTIPFDHVASTTAVAVVNPQVYTTITLTFLFRDQTGQTIFTDSIDMEPQTHRAFQLTDRFPQSANKQGTVEVSGTSNFYLLGLRVTKDTFTSITPFITQ